MLIIIDRKMLMFNMAIDSDLTMKIPLIINGRIFPFSVLLNFVQNGRNSLIETIAYLKLIGPSVFELRGVPSVEMRLHNNARILPRLRKIGYVGRSAHLFLRQISLFAEKGVEIRFQTFEGRSKSCLQFNIQGLFPEIAPETGNLELITSSGVLVPRNIQAKLDRILKDPNKCKPERLIEIIRGFGFDT